MEEKATRFWDNEVFELPWQQITLQCWLKFGMCIIIAPWEASFTITRVVKSCGCLLWFPLFDNPFTFAFPHPHSGKEILQYSFSPGTCSSISVFPYVESILFLACSLSQVSRGHRLRHFLRKKALLSFLSSHLILQAQRSMVDELNKPFSTLVGRISWYQSLHPLPLLSFPFGILSLSFITL